MKSISSYVDRVAGAIAFRQSPRILVAIATILGGFGVVARKLGYSRISNIAGFSSLGIITLCARRFFSKAPTCGADAPPLSEARFQEINSLITHFESHKYGFRFKIEANSIGFSVAELQKALTRREGKSFKEEYPLILIRGNFCPGEERLISERAINIEAVFLRRPIGNDRNTFSVTISTDHRSIEGSIFVRDCSTLKQLRECIELIAKGSVVINDPYLRTLQDNDRVDFSRLHNDEWIDCSKIS